MRAVIAAEGEILARVLDATHAIVGLSRHAYGQFTAALAKTAWGQRRQRQFVLMNATDLLASAIRYDLSGVLDGRPVQVCGIGAVFTNPSHRGQGHARALVDRLLDDAAREGAEMALLFPRVSAACSARHGFEVIPTTDVTITVAEAPRRGAPMTMIRSGEERDLAAVVAMGRDRASPVRFHLDRDADFVQYAITRKRLLAGLGLPGARQLHFFIAEEGITAAAYVVVSVIERTWTLEECGDRDPCGARVGAILQALVAREPAEHRPVIRAWLPPGFAPPQVTTTAGPSGEVLMVRVIGSTSARPPLSGGDVVYWRGDLF
jgi:GNAT superfamily N-acetyltransferase